MEINRDLKNDKLWLTQGKYARKVLAQFNMEDCKPVSTPLAPHFKLSSALCSTNVIGKGLMSKVPYEKAVGSLMYLMTCTRPDLAPSDGQGEQIHVESGEDTLGSCKVDSQVS